MDIRQKAEVAAELITAVPVKTTDTNHICSGNAEQHFIPVGSTGTSRVVLPKDFSPKGILQAVLLSQSKSASYPSLALCSSDHLQNLLAATFWWIHEREFGEKRHAILRDLYAQMSSSFVALLLSTQGSSRDKLLNNLSAILSQSVWICFWMQFPENRVDITRPAFLSALCHDCSVQISGCPPQVASWRSWDFLYLVGVERQSDKVPLELQSLLGLSIDSISGAIKDINNRQNFDINPTDEKVKKAQLVFADLSLEPEKSAEGSKQVEEQTDVSTKLGEKDWRNGVGRTVRNVVRATPAVGVRNVPDMPRKPEFRRECFDLATHSPLYKFQIMAEKGERRTVQRTELISIPDPLGYQPILESSRKFLSNSKKKQNRTETMVKENRRRLRKAQEAVRKRIEGLKNRINKAKESKEKSELEEVLMEAHYYLMSNRNSFLYKT